MQFKKKKLYKFVIVTTNQVILSPICHSDAIHTKKYINSDTIRINSNITKYLFKSNRNYKTFKHETLDEILSSKNL